MGWEASAERTGAWHSADHVLSAARGRHTSELPAMSDDSPLLLLALGAAAALRIPTAPLPHTPTLIPARPARPPRRRACARRRLRWPPPPSRRWSGCARCSTRWLASVWVQGVLTTVSGVLLLSAARRSSAVAAAARRAGARAAGLAAACASSPWAWGYTRPRSASAAARRRRRPTPRAARRAARASASPSTSPG